MTVHVKEEEYGRQYAGAWGIKVLSVREGEDALRKVTNNKDKVGYIHALAVAAIIPPQGSLTVEKIKDMPYQLYRRLIDQVLELNETREEEANFSPSLPSAVQQLSQMVSKETPGE